jgi:hypothetical protein
MTPEETAVLMTYANQIDARVQLTDASVDVWHAALTRIDFDAGRWGIQDYYATANPNDSRGLPAILPATLRHRVNAERDRRIAKQSATRALPPARTAHSWRARNPENWDHLVAKGRDDHRADLTRRGVALLPHQLTA